MQRTRRGLRGRLDRMESQATQTAQAARQTMSNADKLMLQAQTDIIATLHDMILDLQDGVSIKLVRDPDASIMEFFLGDATELPFKIVIDVDEEEEA